MHACSGFSWCTSLVACSCLIYRLSDKPLTKIQQGPCIFSTFVLYMHLVTFRANLTVVLDSREESDKCPTKFIIINFRRWLAFLWVYLRRQYQHPRSSGSGTNMAVLIKYLHATQQAGITSFITLAYESNNSLPSHHRSPSVLFTKTVN
jgi:hypothetical protein